MRKTNYRILNWEITLKKAKGKATPYKPRGFQEAKAPRFRDNKHMKVTRLSALRTGRLYFPPSNEIKDGLLEHDSAPDP